MQCSYAVQALLLTAGLRRNKHSGVLSTFNEHFVKSGTVSSHFFILLRDGFEDRAEGDYGLAPISPEQGQAGISAAHEFVLEIQRLPATMP